MCFVLATDIIYSDFSMNGTLGNIICDFGMSNSQSLLQNQQNVQSECVFDIFAYANDFLLEFNPIVHLLINCFSTRKTHFFK